MKKLLCSVLVLIMSIVCAFALVGCSDDPSGDAAIAKKGAEQLQGLYMSEAEETPADYTRFGQIRVDGTTYPVTWEVKAAADSEVQDLTGFVTVGEKDDSSKEVTISIVKADKEIKYILTATVKVGSAEEKVSFDRKVPAKAASHAGTQEDPYSAVNVQELAAKLEANTFLMDGDVAKRVYVQGYIVETGRDYNTYAQFIYIVDEYSADKDRNAVDAVMILSISYEEGSPVTQFSDIGKGDKILVSGFIQNYQKDADSALQPEVSRWKNPATNKHEPLTVVSLEKAVDSRSDAEKVAATLKTAEAELTTTVFTAAVDYNLPKSSVYGVELSYTSANTDLITVEGNKMTIKSIPETETTVKLTMTAKVGTTEDSKEISITLTKAVDLGTVHAGTEADPYDQADMAKLFATLGDGQVYSENGIEKEVYVKGYVTVVGEVNWNKANTSTYGLKDVYISSTKGATQGDSVLVYNINWGEAMAKPADNTNPLKVGDEVVIKGYLKNYKGTYEVCQSTANKYPVIVSLNGNGGTVTPPTPVTTVHAGTQADPYDQADLAKIFATLADGQIYSDESGEKKVYVKGYVTVVGEVNGNYGLKNVYISSTKGAAQADSVLLYNTNWGGAVAQPADNSNPLKVGDEIIVEGYLKNYGGTYEICQSTAREYPVIVSLNGNGGTVTPDEPVTTVHAGTQADPYDQADLATIFATLANNEVFSDENGEKEVYVKGFVTVVGQINGNYGLKNVYISSAYGATQANSVLVFNINWGEAMAKPADGTNPLKFGDEVVVRGYLKNYNGTYEVCQSTAKQYPVIVSKVAGVDARTESQKVADELAAAELIKESYAATGEFLLPSPKTEGVTFSWVSANTALVTVEGNTMKVVALPEAETTVKLTLTATINQTQESREFTLTIAAAPVVVPGQSTATLSFVEDANRTEFDAAVKQVWSANGITLTNEKATSTSALRDKLADDHIRLYKDSKVKIEAANMVKIVFNCTENGSKDYATDLETSLASLTGITITKDAANRKLTVTFATPVNSFEFTCGAQIRFDSIEVTTTTTAAAPAAAALMPYNPMARAAGVGSSRGAEQQVTLDFVTNFGTYASGWNNQYNTERIVTFAQLGETTHKGVVSLYASKQTGTITNMPVIKAGPVTVKLGEGEYLKSIQFKLKQWVTTKTAKAVTISIEYSTDGSETNLKTANITDKGAFEHTVNFTENVNLVKLSNGQTKNQVGIDSIILTYASSDTPSETAAQEAVRKELEKVQLTQFTNVNEVIALPTPVIDGVTSYEWASEDETLVDVTKDSNNVYKMKVVNPPITQKTVKISVTATLTDGSKVTQPYDVTVPSSLSHAGTAEDPYTVADVQLILATLNSGEKFNGSADVYVKGIVTDAGALHSSYGLQDVYIADDKENSLLLYNVNWSDAMPKPSDGSNPLKVGDIVVVKGGIEKNSTGTGQIHKGSSWAVFTSKETPVMTAAEKIELELKGVEAELTTIIKPTNVPLHKPSDESVKFNWTITSGANVAKIVNGELVVEAETYPTTNTTVTLSLIAKCEDVESEPKTVTVLVKAPEQSVFAPTIVNIGNYASKNNWVDEKNDNSTTLTIDGIITVTAGGGGNTGKYYAADSSNAVADWRFYQSDTATLDFSTVKTGYTIVSVTLTFENNNSGCIVYGGNKYKSGHKFDVNATTTTFSIGSENANATNGRVDITDIAVVYKKDGEEPATAKYIGIFNNELVYAKLDFTGTGLKSDGTAARFGFALSLYNENGEPINGIMADGTTSQLIYDLVDKTKGKFFTTAQGVNKNYKISSYKVEENKIVMDFYVTNVIDAVNNTDDKAFCSEDITIKLKLEVNGVALEATGTRKLKDIAKLAYENGELGADNTAALNLAKKYGYEETTQQ